MGCHFRYNLLKLIIFMLVMIMAYHGFLCSFLQVMQLLVFTGSCILLMIVSHLVLSSFLISFLHRVGDIKFFFSIIVNFLLVFISRSYCELIIADNTSRNWWFAEVEGALMGIKKKNQLDQIIIFPSYWNS